jgi:hypothetical protein
MPWLHVFCFELFQLELSRIFHHKCLVAVHVIGEDSHEVRPRPHHHVLAVVITAEDDDLALFAHLSGCEVDRNVVSTPSLWLRESSPGCAYAFWIAFGG